jgi:hypothetical protein
MRSVQDGVGYGTGIQQIVYMLLKTYLRDKVFISLNINKFKSFISIIFNKI